MNNKAMQMAISTLILIILGIIVLIAIIAALTGQFSKFKSTTDPFTDTATVTAVKTACQDACTNNLKLIYCCEEYDIDGGEVDCSDPRLETSCPAITCEADFCNPRTIISTEECTDQGGEVIPPTGVLQDVSASKTCTEQNKAYLGEIKDLGVEDEIGQGVCCK